MEDKKNALIRISQFVLRGEEINDVRDDLLECIFEMAIFWGGDDKGIIKNMISKTVRDQLSIDIPERIERMILNKLLEKKRIGFDGRYYLSDNVKLEIKQRIDRKNEIISYINIKLINRVHVLYETDEFSDEQIDYLLQIFYGFLSNLFLSRSEIASSIITGIQKEISELDIPRDILKKAVAEVEDIKLRKSLEKAIIDLFSEPSDTLANFLYTTNQNMIYLQILNLDPECRVLQIEELKKKTLFLDTNIVLPILCEDYPQREFIRELINLNKKIGVKLVFTYKTEEEFLNVLENANKSYSSIDVPKNILKHVNDPFISSFASESRIKPQQTWEGFYYRMRRVHSLLKNNWKIDYYDDKHEDIMNKSHFNDISKKVDSCYKEVRGGDKRKEVADHDAFHMILIKELRKDHTPSILGPDYWFLTLDTTLFCVENTMNELLDYKDPSPASLHCDLWMDIISPFLTSNLMEGKESNLYAGYLMSHFAALPYSLSPDTLKEIQGDWMYYDWLSSQDIVEILNERFVNSYIQKVQSLRLSGEDTSDVKSEFNEQLSTKLEELVEEKIKLRDLKIQELEEEMKTKEKKLSELDVKVSEMSDTISFVEQSKQFWKSVAGVFGVLIISTILVAFWLGIIIPDSSSVPFYLGLCVIGVILFLLAIAPEQVQAKLESIIRIGKN